MLHCVIDTWIDSLLAVATSLKRGFFLELSYAESRIIVLLKDGFNGFFLDDKAFALETKDLEQVKDVLEKHGIVNRILEDNVAHMSKATIDISR